ncbi:uncharacterized protein PV09_08532 [Verruconis gallopava]|uniref:Pyruvate decarboxylase n=1 Tax=Verruconis gallopava TaxID=253628 RepID=A0A0D2A0M4_9PEZI|nr:uncharacterized protein PV09_08532 [Verruconis gallopava]KIV99864.1 hypothetical protein PV09_08532 [Verruconis gallopava]
MSRTIPLAQYLFSRLHQLGCYSIHGVPGDFTLRALDHLRASKVKWIGNASELCAGYAADGYARSAAMARKSLSTTSPRVGALFVTYGVGELSAINALAGAYAESVPVVQLVGTPSRKAWRSRPILHHTMADGRLGVYADIAKHVTCAQADLSCDDVEEAIERYDETLVQCVQRSKPVYVNVPIDMVEKPVPSKLLHRPLPLEPVRDKAVMNEEDRVVQDILKRIMASEKPLIIADGLSYSWDLVDEANEIVHLTGIPSMCFSAGKGVIDEHHPSWLGPLTTSTDYSRSADLVLLFGPLLSNTNTAAWTVVPDPGISVSINLDNVNICGQVFSVRGKYVLQKLVERLKAQPLGQRWNLDRHDRNGSLRAERSPSPSSPISQDALWERMSTWLRPHDTYLLANGTPLVGGRSIAIPSPTQVVASGIWCSIGSMLPCAQGIALAKRDHNIPGRSIIYEGDGSLQVTCQSISDIIRYKLDVTIVVCNNAGYTYERYLHGMREEYNDVPVWSYADAPAFFGAKPGNDYRTMSTKVETWGELNDVLGDENFADGQGLKIIDIVMDPEDMPSSAKAGLKRASEALRLP